MKITLSKPIKTDEQEINVLVLDLEKLTGQQIIEAEGEARLRGDKSPDPLSSSLGTAIIAAKASGVFVEDLIALPAPDFLLVTNSVSNFLFGWALRAGMAEELATESKT